MSEARRKADYWRERVEDHGITTQTERLLAWISYELAAARESDEMDSDLRARLGDVIERVQAVERSLPVLKAWMETTDSEWPDVASLVRRIEGVEADLAGASTRMSRANDPGYTNEGVESDGDLLARLGTDAVKWAEDFVRSVSARDDDFDVDQVMTWFANALEAGRSAGYDQQRRDSFLYNVASCGECSATHRAVTLCPHHRAMVVLAREEVHGQ